MKYVSCSTGNSLIKNKSNWSYISLIATCAPFMWKTRFKQILRWIRADRIKKLRWKGATICHCRDICFISKTSFNFEKKVSGKHTVYRFLSSKKDHTYLSPQTIEHRPYTHDCMETKCMKLMKIKLYLNDHSVVHEGCNIITHKGFLPL